jgi:chromosome partition protein MukE
LVGLVGDRDLVHALNPRRRKYAERVAQETVRLEIGKALRGLERLGFVDLIEDTRVRLRLSLLRFAEAVRGSGDPAEMLAKLVAAGKAVTDIVQEAENEPEEGEA